MMNLINYIGIAVGALGVIITTSLYSKRKVRNAEYIFWSALWLSIILFSIVPALAVALANMAGINRGSDLLIYISIMLILYLIFRIYVRLDELERTITKVVRSAALKDDKDPKKPR